VLAIAANGISHMTPAELAEIDRDYLPPIEPRWDGAPPDLAVGADARADGILPVVQAQRRRPHGLRHGAARAHAAPSARSAAQLAGYDVAYRAAFHADATGAVRDSCVPTLITAAAGDPLHVHLARLGVTRAGLEIRGLPTPAEVEAAASEFLLRAIRETPDSPRSWPAAASAAFAHASVVTASGEANARADADVDADASARVNADAITTGRGFLGAPGAQLHARALAPVIASRNDRVRLVVLHDATESAAAIDDLLAACAVAGFSATAPDLPGHGESVGIAASAGRASERARLVDGVSAQVAEALKTLPGEGPVTLLGLGAGATLALAIAAHAGGGAPFEMRRVVAWQPYCWPAADREAIVAAFAEVPEVAWHGGHLAHAWIRATDAGLFHPWCLRRRGHAWRGAPRVDTLQVHERAFALLLSGAAGRRWRRRSRPTTCAIASMPRACRCRCCSTLRVRSAISMPCRPRSPARAPVSSCSKPAATAVRQVAARSQREWRGCATPVRDRQTRDRRARSERLAPRGSRDGQDSGEFQHVPVERHHGDDISMGTDLRPYPVQQAREPENALVLHAQDDDPIRHRREGQPWPSSQFSKDSPLMR
jgi:hypothetical protein